MPGTPEFGVVRKREFGVETGLRIWLPDFQVPSWLSIMTTLLKILICIIFPQNKQSLYMGRIFFFQWKAFSFLLKYNPHTISYYFQVYIVVIWYIYVLKWSPWCLFTTCHHTKLLQYYEYIPYTIHYTLWFIYYIAGNLSLLTLFTYLVSRSNCFPLWKPSVCLLYLRVCFSFVLFVLFFRFCIQYMWNHMLIVFLWLSIIPSRLIHIIVYGKISFFKINE